MQIVKIDSWKNANKSALIQAVLSALFCIIYTYVIMFFTGGEEFVGKQPAQEMVNGIRRDVVLVISGILSGVIPILLLRYEKLKFLTLYIPMSIIYYFVVMLLCVLFVIDDNFDLITYAVTSVPIGSFIGTIIAILINLYRRNNK
jgi:hypothetical protein